MALQFITANSTGLGVRASLGDVDSLYVAAGVSVVSLDTVAIVGIGSGHVVTMAGSVITGSDVRSAIELGNSDALDINQKLVVTAGGLVSGNFAVALLGANSQLENHGTISGGSIGAYMDSAAAGTTRILNSGTITARDFAIQTESVTTNVLTNLGLISADVYSYFSFNVASDSIINRGTMIGNISLGDGTDTYDGRGGSIIGTIYGGSGTDTFIAGNSAENFDGGDGVDTLDFRAGAAVTAQLDGSDEGTGAALGDTYFSIENIIGSRAGADTLTGSAEANALLGLGGADRINGAGGADVLSGGGGIDILTGGTGNDVFQFVRAVEGGDIITDFTNVVGNDDRFRISAVGFGAGLVVGALAATQFQIRADNLAQDADDRFIFRTTDKTLWFDTNGNAAGGLTLIADLQASATMTAADILVF